MTRARDTASLPTGIIVDSTGLVWVGDSTDLSNVTELGMTISTNTSVGTQLVVRKSVDAASASNMTVARSRGTNASPTILQNGDNIGAYAFHAYDGSSYLQTAYILASVDGTPGVGDMPSRMVFYTGADGSSSGTERMRIDNAGNVGIGTTPSYPLHISAATAEIRAASSTGTNHSRLVLTNTGGSFQYGIDTSTGGSYGFGAYARVLWNDGAYPMVFTTNSTERMRIDGSGNVFIGTNVTAGTNTGGLTIQGKDIELMQIMGAY